MSGNGLLLWMSARGKGSWQQFRSAVEELHLSDSDDGEQGRPEEDVTDPYALPLYQELRLNMQRFGHAEFFSGAGGSDWRVTPPSLAVTGHARSWLGVLAGARSPKLLRRVQDAAAPLTLETLELAACPDQIRIVGGDSRALAAFANRAGLILQHDAPAAILKSLPHIDDPAVRRRTDLPFGVDWKIEQFSSADLGWRTGAREDALSASGDLFRFSLRHQRHVLFCSQGLAFAVPVQVGKFLVLRHRQQQVLAYDTSNSRLSFPASCRPPFLVERALILCSGTLPSYEAGILHYTKVSREIARLASALLRQALK